MRELMRLHSCKQCDSCRLSNVTVSAEICTATYLTHANSDYSSTGECECCTRVYQLALFHTTIFVEINIGKFYD